MKRPILFIILVLSSLSIHAQSSWGVTGGKLFNNFYNPSAKIISNSSNESFTAGIFYQRPICSHSSLYTSLSYEDKTTVESGNNLPYNTTTNLNYLTLEIGSYIPIKKFSIGGGIYYSSLLSSYRSITNNEMGLQIVGTIPQDATKYDAGITASVKYNLNDRLSLYSKVNWGLVQLTTYREGDQRFITCGMGMPSGDFWYNGQYSDGKLRSFYNKSLTLGINYTVLK